MKIRILEFKNGSKIKISVEVANILNDRICGSGGALDMQCFKDAEDNGDTKLIIRLSEVAAIYDNESII